MSLLTLEFCLLGRELSADLDELLDGAKRYEDRAIDVLDAIRDEKDAAQLITLITWQYVESTETKEVSRRELWAASPLESAAEEDGLLSVPCMRFISHRHSQYLLNKHFAGDFPGSSACIPQDGSSLLRIAIQIFLPFLPGTVVEVMPCEDADNVARVGDSVAEDRKKDEGSGGLAMDPDLVDVLEELNGKKIRSIGDENSLADLISDLVSFRFLTFYTVPKVKFVMHLMQHLLFMTLLTIVLIGTYEDDAISKLEVLFWAWTVAREIGEFNEIESFTASGLRLYARDIWNQMDMATFALVIVTASIRVLAVGGLDGVGEAEAEDSSNGRQLLAKSSRLPSGDPTLDGSLDPGAFPFEPALPLHATCRCLYALLVVLVDIRVFQYLRYFQSLGVLSHRDARLRF